MIPRAGGATSSPSSLARGPVSSSSCARTLHLQRSAAIRHAYGQTFFRKERPIGRRIRLRVDADWRCEIDGSGGPDGRRARGTPGYGSTCRSTLTIDDVRHEAPVQRIRIGTSSRVNAPFFSIRGSTPARALDAPHTLLFVRLAL